MARYGAANPSCPARGNCRRTCPREGDNGSAGALQRSPLQQDRDRGVEARASERAGPENAANPMSSWRLDHRRQRTPRARTVCISRQWCGAAGAARYTGELCIKLLVESCGTLCSSALEHGPCGLHIRKGGPVSGREREQRRTKRRGGRIARWESASWQRDVCRSYPKCFYTFEKPISGTCNYPAPTNPAIWISLRGECQRRGVARREC